MSTWADSNFESDWAAAAHGGEEPGLEAIGVNSGWSENSSSERAEEQAKGLL